MMVEIGDSAPIASVKLTSNDEVNKSVNLCDLYAKGLTVIYWFPAAFTGVCTKSSCQIRDDIKEFEELATHIYGASTDSPFSQKVFREMNKLNFPLLSDWNREAIRKFGIEDPDFAGGLKGFPKRSLWAIKDSVIIFKWIANSPGDYPPFDQLKHSLKL